ncbi:MAG: hypothetical protein KKB70_01440 [Proteobacteria bacterium]|nr:hypothetical protein [Pseudomonadota bacterium]MBU1610946.1 hypothetical protein [Pseudomonadota bacterium]
MSPPSRPSLSRRLRRLLAVLLTGLVLWLLTQVPYGIIRQERIRAFGETPAMATVVEVTAREGNAGRRYLATYRYIGPDGMARLRNAPFPLKAWRTLAPGSRIVVYYATGEPNISRARLELEVPFQVWLRQFARGDDLPENTQIIDQ